jgi:hypothetical protein
MLLVDKNRGLGDGVGDVGGVSDPIDRRLECLEHVVEGVDGELVDRAVHGIDGPTSKWRT